MTNVQREKCLQSWARFAYLVCLACMVKQHRKEILPATKFCSIGKSVKDYRGGFSCTPAERAILRTKGKVVYSDCQAVHLGIVQ